MTLNSMAPLEPVIGVIGTGYLGTTHAAYERGLRAGLAQG